MLARKRYGFRLSEVISIVHIHSGLRSSREEGSQSRCKEVFLGGDICPYTRCSRVLTIIIGLEARIRRGTHLSRRAGQLHLRGE